MYNEEGAVDRPSPLDSISECAEEIQRSGKQLDNEYYIQCNNRRNDKLDPQSF